MKWILLILATLIPLAAFGRDEAQTTTRYRYNSVITIDPTVQITAEDGSWTNTAKTLGYLSTATSDIQTQINTKATKTSISGLDSGITNSAGASIDVRATNAAASLAKNYQPATTILSNLVVTPLTNASPFQPATTILSNLVVAPLTNASAFQPATTILSNLVVTPLTNAADFQPAAASLTNINVLLGTKAANTNASIVDSLAVTGVTGDGIRLAVRRTSAQTNDIFQVQTEGNGMLFGVTSNGVATGNGGGLTNLNSSIVASSTGITVTPTTNAATGRITYTLSVP
jgi:hypothetical protein